MERLADRGGGGAGAAVELADACSWSWRSTAALVLDIAKAVLDERPAVALVGSRRSATAVISTSSAAAGCRPRGAR